MRRNDDQLALQFDALERAEHGQSLTNYPAIFAGFMAKGISEADIRPRENVFTFNAWKAKGRIVRKRPAQVGSGEYGVRIVTFVPITDKESGEITGKRPFTSTVFHLWQTVSADNPDEPLNDWQRQYYTAAARPEPSKTEPAKQPAPSTYRANASQSTRQWIEA